MMVTRVVSLRLKPNRAADFNRTVERDIVPMLRKQRGYRDCITLIAPNEKEALGISFWDNDENAEAYDRMASTELPKLLGDTVEGKPEVKTYTLEHSTIQSLESRAA